MTALTYANVGDAAAKDICDGYDQDDDGIAILTGKLVVSVINYLYLYFGKVQTGLKGCKKRCI